MRVSLSILMLIFFLLPMGTQAATIRVPADQPTIQAGIDVAEDGDTVLVSDGLYTGQGNTSNDLRQKAITVRSANGYANCIIDCQYLEVTGFNITGCDLDTVIQGFTVRNSAIYGISCGNETAITISECKIANNLWSGIICYGSTIHIRDCVIVDNSSENSNSGGGLLIAGGAVLIEGTFIADNRFLGDLPHRDSAGGLFISGADVLLVNCTIKNNTATFGKGGALLANTSSDIVMQNCTVLSNAAQDAGGIYLDHDSHLTVDSSIFWNNNREQIEEAWGSAEVTFSDVEGGFPGQGNIDADPLLVHGPLGNHYLSQTQAGQAVNSPCVNAGDPDSTWRSGTTRTDHVPDSVTVDMGYHYQAGAGNTPPETLITAGPEGDIDSPGVTFVFTGSDDHDLPSELLFSWRFNELAWSEYESTTQVTVTNTPVGPQSFSVRARDTGLLIDPTPAIREFYRHSWSSEGRWDSFVTGPGPGPVNPPLVRTSQEEWYAYGVMTYGVNVACGNIDGDGYDEIITGPGPAAVFGPHVRGFRRDGTALGIVHFFAYGTHKYGVNVAAGDIDCDGNDEIITGAGPGAVFGPHVRGWNCDGSPTEPIPTVSFFAYGTPKWGVNVNCGDIDGDGCDEIVTGAGPGAVFGPHVRGWDHDGTGGVTSMAGVNFFAYGTPRWGVKVACGDLDGDGYDEIITGPGPGVIFSAHVRAFNYDDDWVSPMAGVSFLAYPSFYGVVVGAGDVDGDGRDEILTLPGPGQGLAAHVKAWAVDGATVSQVETVDFLAYDTWYSHSGTIAGGYLD